MSVLDDFRRRSIQLQQGAAMLEERFARADLSEASPELMKLIVDTVALLGEMRLKLAKGEQFVQAFFEGSLDAFALTDLNFAFIEVNAATASLFGVSKEMLLGRTGAEFVAPGWDTSRAQKRFESAGQLVSEFPLQRPDGEKRAVEYTVRGNVVPGIHFAVMRDVTVRERLSEQLRHAQKMDAIGVLASGVAHDFNNMLSVILSCSWLVLEQLGREEPLRPEIEQIVFAGERAAELTRQLLAFSRRQVFEPRHVDLNGVVAKLDPMLRRIVGEHIKLTIVGGQGLWSLYCDPGQIEQVIVNLVANARDAMLEGGHLTIETANIEIDQAYASTHIDVRPGEYVMLAITDTGIGIDNALLARIFEPFFTTKPEGRGTGLGLAMAFGVVKQSGGNIWVYSELGRGTTFKIYLPRREHPTEAEPQQSEPVRPVIERGNETVLLVEDDEALRALAGTILRRDGYNVLEARNGGEALLICEQYAATIHLLVTDVVMPLMSGPQLAKRLAPLRPDMKVLYVSGYTDNSVMHHGVPKDASMAFLQKPLRGANLLRKIREVLGGTSPASER